MTSSLPSYATLPSYASQVLEKASGFMHRAAEAVDLDGAKQEPSFLSRTLDDIHQQMVRGKAFDIDDLPALLDSVNGLSGTGIDDRLMLLEKSIVLMSRLPDDSKISAALHRVVIDILYKDLSHPPSSFIALSTPSYSLASGKQSSPATDGKTAPYDTGNTTVPSEYAYTNGHDSTEAADSVRKQATSSYSRSVPYAFRSADGSGYSINLPSLGKAGAPYARTVVPLNTSSPQTLPDAGLVFDLLLKRQPNAAGSPMPETDADGFAPHPGGVNSLFFAFADLVIHTIFYTDHFDEGVNRTSSYVDLSTLYGNGWPVGVGYGPTAKPGPSENDAVRRLDGTGRLWEDVFTDARLLFMPPPVCALMILFCRNHNYIAQKIFEINEWESYVDPSELNETERRAQDDELYNRARLVNCGFFVEVVLGDYVGGILGLTRDGLPWRFNPVEESRELDHKVSPRGEGNACSVEFNLVYRWHAALSREDTAWTEDVFESIFKTRDFSSITPDTFVKTIGKIFPPKEDVKQWSFHGVNGKPLVRDPVTGRFNDSDLAAILHKATESPASTFKARGIPEVLRVVEVLGIEQARRWGTATLNEFRKFMSLKPYKSFAEWNPDPTVHKAAERLYKHIDNLELHVGLQAEEAKKPMPGVGFCPGFTISRAILADAVALTRGDKFLTTELTVHNLTKWGFQECFGRKDDGSVGGVLPRLLYRALPDHYSPNSSFARFPFMVPSTMEMYMNRRMDSEVSRYSFDKPRPAPVVVTRSFEGVCYVLKQQEKFESDFERKLKVLTNKVKPNISLVNTALDQLNHNGRYSALFADIAEKLLKEKSLAIPGSRRKQVDIVGDVINLIPVYFASTELLGLPIKTDHTPHGIFRDQEIYQMFADLGNFVFMNNSGYSDWALQNKAVKATEFVIDAVEGHLTRLLGQGVVSQFSTSLIGWYTGSINFGENFLKKVVTSSKGASKRLLAISVFAAIATTAALYSKALAIVVDFFLDEENKEARASLEKLASEGWDNDAKIYQLVRDVLRLDPPVPIVTRTAKTDVTLPDLQQVKQGQKVVCSIMEANTDSVQYGENSFVVDIQRHAPGILGFEEVGLINSTFIRATLPKVLQVIFRLKNAERARGSPGRLPKVNAAEYDCPTVEYMDLESQPSPYPTMMSIQYDA